MVIQTSSSRFCKSLTDLRDCTEPFDTIAQNGAGWDLKYYELSLAAYNTLTSYIGYDVGESLYCSWNALEQFMFLCFVIEAEATRTEE